MGGGGGVVNIYIFFFFWVQKQTKSCGGPKKLEVGLIVNIFIYSNLLKINDKKIERKLLV